MFDPKHQPLWPIVIFGNGCQAKAKRIIPNIMQDDGVLVTEFHIDPTPEMKDYYNIKSRDLNKEGLLVERYPQINVIIPQTRRGTIIRTAFILQGYEWEDTVMTEMYPNTKLIQRYQAENRTLRSKIAALEEEIRLIMTRPDEYIKNMVMMIKTARRAAGDMVDPGFTGTSEMPGYSPQMAGGPEND